MAESQELINKVAKYLEKYMARYDGSHDFHHLGRVVGLSHDIYNQLKTTNPSTNLNLTIITLSALLHDVGDRKYVTKEEDPATMIRELLLGFGANRELAEKVQTICKGVSWSSEIKDTVKVKELIEQHPELAVVQDADRLDALGAVGVGRVFTYGGATNREMEDSMSIFESNLLRMEASMKTEPGKQMAKQRTEILRNFRKWWNEEVKIEGVGASVLKSALDSDSSGVEKES
jgi:uncharacterized protein